VRHHSGAVLTRAPARVEPSSTWRAVLLTIGVGAAMGVRVAAGGSEPAASEPAAALFAMLLLVVAVAAGLRPGRPSLGWLAAGTGAGALLFALWSWSAGVPAPLRLAAPSPELLTWSLIVTAVAVAEEAVLRGVLFAELLRARGPVLALLVSSAAFAVLHLPLYGWQALPVDFGVGLCLGGLRLVSGGIAAPAAAHAAADLAAGWLV
jgi:membrane protease YdiL (CAAX protease family)